jgi:hypothetical protein
MTIRNADTLMYLKEAFGDRWEQAWVEWGTFDGGGLFRRNGYGRVGKLAEGSPPEDQAVYVCCGLLKPGSTRRCIENVSRVHVLCIDDVGSKIDLADMEAGVGMGLVPEPSATIETSPGNFQWHYFIAGGMEVEQYRALRKAMRSNAIHGHSDAISPANLIRLPMGVNGKPGMARHDVAVQQWGISS